MFNSGPLVGSWVQLERGTNIEYRVCGDEVELNFGGWHGNFQLSASEAGLNELITKGSEALDKLRAGDIDE